MRLLSLTLNRAADGVMRAPVRKANSAPVRVARAAVSAAPELIFALLLIVTVSFAVPAAGQTVSRVNGQVHAGEFNVPVHQSQVLRLDVPFTDLLVGDPKIADVLALTDRSVYVLGKALGTTSLTIYGPGKRLLTVVDIVVTHDIKGLKSRLNELLPKERVEVRSANGALILSGKVSSANKVAQALSIAERFAPSNVTNLLGVTGSQQVMLAVRFAEVQRNVAKELGLNTGITTDKVQVLIGDTLLSGLISASTFGFGSFAATIGSTTLQFLFEALEQKGVVKTLAEPNLIALSGDTASFLAGGEFPVPVAQEGDSGSPTITVEFKEFGISLAFTPTVLDDGLINIVVQPEVSRIDRTNSVTVSGFNIPGLTTRRAKTTVELRDGEGFAIAGLIQSDFQDTVRQFPVLGDVPVLGALMRSSDFQRNESELVIIVTPHLVKPAPAEALSTPADNFVPPSEVDIWLLGRTEGPGSGLTPSGAAALGAQGAGGIVGRYGHIVK